MTKDEDDKESESVSFLMIPLQPIPHTSMTICNSTKQNSEAGFPTSDGSNEVHGGRGCLPKGGVFPGGVCPDTPREQNHRQV